MTARSAALILAVAVVAALCLCLVAPAEGSGAFGRQRRSVNFTPSWGKRSGEEAAVEVAVGAHDECGDPTRGRRIDLLVQRIKSEMRAVESCVRRFSSSSPVEEMLRLKI